MTLTIVTISLSASTAMELTPVNAGQAIQAMEQSTTVKVRAVDLYSLLVHKQCAVSFQKLYGFSVTLMMELNS